MVHCGSVRQAAHVIQMAEMRSAGGAAIKHEHGVSLAPAVAAAAALLCTSAAGAARTHPPDGAGGILSAAAAAHALLCRD